MSAEAQTLPVPARPIASYLFAILLALTVGAAAGSLITRALTTDAPAVGSVVGIVPWDQQKLDAVAGRQAAEAVAVDGPGIRPWDRGMLDAMEAIQSATRDPGIRPWDRGKLDAAEGLQAAAANG